MPKQSQLAEGIASLRFTSLSMTSLKNWFLEQTQKSLENSLNMRLKI
jgi:hypothetical protein